MLPEIKIYRVVDKRNCGMYTGFDRDFKIESDRQYLASEDYEGENDVHPTPDEDPLMEDHWNCFYSTFGSDINFGFVSLDQLKRWVGKETREKMAAINFKVIVVTTDTYLIGDTQVAFIPKEIVDTLSILEI